LASEWALRVHVQRRSALPDSPWIQRRVRALFWDVPLEEALPQAPFAPACAGPLAACSLSLATSSPGAEACRVRSGSRGSPRRLCTFHGGKSCTADSFPRHAFHSLEMDGRILLEACLWMNHWMSRILSDPSALPARRSCRLQLEALGPGPVDHRNIPRSAGRPRRDSRGCLRSFGYGRTPTSIASSARHGLHPLCWRDLGAACPPQNRRHHWPQRH